MAKKQETKPNKKDYDRWGNTGVKVIGKPKKTVKRGK